MLLRPSDSLDAIAEMKSLPTILLVADPPERLRALSDLLAAWPLVKVSAPLEAIDHLARPEVTLIIVALSEAPDRCLAELRQIDADPVRPILCVTRHPAPDPAPNLVDFISPPEDDFALRARVGFLLDLLNRGGQSQQELLAFAHDLNNMLTVTLWNLDLLARSGCGTEKDQQRIETATLGALRCASLIRSLIPVQKDPE